MLAKCWHHDRALSAARSCPRLAASSLISPTMVVPSLSLAASLTGHIQTAVRPRESASVHSVKLHHSF
jgi:hypothetical protein